MTEPHFTIKNIVVRLPQWFYFKVT